MVRKELINYSILEKEKISAHAIAVLAISSLVEKTKKSDKQTTSLMKKFYKGNKKTNNDGIAVAVITI